MSEWQKVNLGDCCEITSSKRIFFSEYVESGIPFYRSKEIIEKGKGEEISHPLYISKEKYDEIKGKYGVPQKGDLLLTAVGSLGIPFVVKDDSPFYFKDGNLVWLKHFQDIDPIFLYYWIKSENGYNALYNIAIGSAQKALTIAAIKGYEIPLPPLQTQHRIANILSRYDSLIENYQKQIKLLEEAAQRLYKEWFVDLRFPGHENAKIVDGVPEGWEKKTIDDVTCKVTTGLNPRKNFVLGKGSNYYVTIKNMADNTLFLDDRCDRVDNEALEKINKRSDLKIGDILFSGIGTIGRVALVDIPTNNWNVSESVFTLRVNDIVTKEFLYLMLLSPDMQNYCQSNAHGAAQKGIRMADLKAYSFYLPPFGVIQKFTNLVTPTIKKVSSIRNQIRLLTEARDRLLPRLMNGEIAV